MVAGLSAWWRGLRHVQNRSYLYVWANLLWVVLSLPIVTAPAAWAGLVKMSSLAYRSPSASVNDLWDGFRENFRRCLPIALLNAAFLMINFSNLYTYRPSSSLAVNLIRALWIVVLFLWFGVQFYMWPLYYWMEAPSLKGALRNAGVMMLLNPLFTLVIWAGALLVIALSILLTPAWALLMGGALASIANSAVIDRLQAAGFAKDVVNDQAFASDAPDDTM